MAWEARSGLKRHKNISSLYPQLWGNGLGSPFGFETMAVNTIEGGNSHGEMAWEARSGLKPVGAFSSWASSIKGEMAWEARSGLKPHRGLPKPVKSSKAKWPGKPVRV